jgi:hypothetical protein
MPSRHGSGDDKSVVVGQGLAASRAPSRSHGAGVRRPHRERPARGGDESERRRQARAAAESGTSASRTLPTSSNGSVLRYRRAERLGLRRHLLRIGYTVRLLALYRSWEEPLASEPKGVYLHDDGRPLLGRKLKGKSKREMGVIGLATHDTSPG